jgi:hypothetical protein
MHLQRLIINLVTVYVVDITTSCLVKVGGACCFNIQWNLELRTQSVPGDGSTFKLFDSRVKFSHKK